ncbi:MAG: cyclic nucleotide-binding domain-containing protein [Verrucomicrobiota bacterium]
MSIAKLRDLPVFKGLKDTHLKALEETLDFSTYPDGRFMVKAGKESTRDKDEFFVILGGKVIVSTHTTSPNQVPVERTLNVGDIFGLVTFLNGGARTANCRADGFVSAVSLKRKRYEELLKSNPTLASELLFVLAAQLARDVRACNTGILQAIENAATGGARKA